MDINKTGSELLGERLKEIESLNKLKLSLKNKLADARLSEMEHKSKLKVYLFRDTATLLAPFVVTGSIICSIVCLCGGGTPFFKDKTKKYKEYIFEYNSEDDIILKEKYVPFENKVLFIENEDVVVYSPWEKQNDEYIRTKTNYIVSGNELLLMNAILNKELDSLDKDTIKHKDEYQTTSAIIDEENNNEIIKANMQFYDNDDLISEEESNKKNLIITLIELISTGAVAGGFTFLCNKDPYEAFKEEIRKIKKARQDKKEYEEQLKETEDKILSLSNMKGGR